HVLGGERYLLVALAHIGSNGLHDLVFWQIDLRVEIRQTKLASASTSGCHFDYAEGGAPIWKQNSFARSRVVYFDFTRQIFAANCFAEKIEGVQGFTGALYNTIDAQLIVKIGLNNLPTAGTTDDHFE